MVVNIYLTKEQNIKLDNICRKYQVSKSTVAEKVLFYLTKYLLKQENGKEIIKKFGEEYIYTEKGYKTSIKPKVDPVNNGIYKNLTRAYTNVIQIWLKKDIKLWLVNENLQYIYNDINNELQKIKEPNWDYNHFIRSMKRYEKRRTEK